MNDLSDPIKTFQHKTMIKQKYTRVHARTAPAPSSVTRSPRCQTDARSRSATATFEHRVSSSKADSDRSVVFWRNFEGLFYLEVCVLWTDLCFGLRLGIGECISFWTVSRWRSKVYLGVRWCVFSMRNWWTQFIRVIQIT